MTPTISKILKGSSGTGSLNFKDSVIFDGHFDGDVNCEQSIAIESNGEMKGTLRCSDLDLFGKMRGLVSATGVVTLNAGSEFEGVLHCHKLSMDPSSSFSGEILAGYEAKSEVVESSLKGS